MVGRMERVLVPSQLPRLLDAVHAALVAHRDEVDALNVFPVPDGDTGTNLAATAEAVVQSIGTATPEPADITRAALRSARGNSGVIFSQIVRAVVDAIADPEATGDVDVLARGLRRADHLGRDAVAEPVEGTILTAVTVAARTAEEARDAGKDDLVEVLELVRVAVGEAVRATKEQLDVLRDAGVVDAGARGFEVVIAALEGAVAGQEPQVVTLANLVPSCLPGMEDDLDRHPIEVQFVVAGNEAVARDLRGRLTELGGSVVVVEADGLVQAHVHTADPDAVVALANEVGEPEDVRTTDLRTQSGGAADNEDRPTLAVVAVLPEGGLADLGTGAGAAVVHGAAGRLPDVDAILRAAASTGAERVAVLPGHPNAVPTARQAALVSGDEDGPELVVVHEATHPLLVLAALTLQDDDPDSLAEVVASARAGEIVAAVRDAELSIGTVRRGDAVAMANGRPVAVGQDLGEVLGKLLSHLAASSSELVTIAVGADADLDVGAVMQAAVPEVGDAEVDVLDGGQRPALVLVCVE